MPSKMISELAKVVVAALAGIWVWRSPGFEPAIVLVVAIGAIFADAADVYGRGAWTSLFGRILAPFARWRDRRTPKALVEFDTLVGSYAIHHTAKAMSVWDAEGRPTTWIEFRYKQGSGSWTTVRKFEGHSVELDVCDVDGDNQPEVILRFACGAHTRAIEIYRVGLDGFLSVLPGSEIGSDWPEIVLEDRDSDGRVEIYAKQRNWSETPTRDYVTEIYTLQDGEYTLIT